MKRWIASVGMALALVACQPAQEASDAQTLKRGNGPEPESLSIHEARSESALTILRDIREGLLAENARGKLEPAVAERWTVDALGMNYLFALRPTAKWSDGSPVLAEDFVRAWHMLAEKSSVSPYRDLLSEVSQVSAKSERELAVKLHQSSAAFLKKLSHPATYPLAKHHAEYPLLSNGAFVLEKPEFGRPYQAKRNAYYWRDAENSIDEVIYHHIDDAEAELNRFRAGELDLTYTLPARKSDWLQSQEVGSVVTSEQAHVYFYGINLELAKFAHQPALRKALSLAIDRDYLVSNITQFGEAPAYRFVAESLLPNLSCDAEASFQHQTERDMQAKKLLDRAGIKVEDLAPVTIRINTSDLHKRIAIAISQMWQDKLGIETTIVNEEWRVFVQNRRQKNTEVFRASWIADYADPETFLSLFLSDSPLNDTGFSHEGFDALVQAANKELDPEKRLEFLKHAECVLLEQQAVIPLYFYVSKHMLSPRLRGWQANPLDIHLTRTLFFEVLSP